MSPKLTRTFVFLVLSSRIVFAQDVLVQREELRTQERTLVLFLTLPTTHTAQTKSEVAILLPRFEHGNIEEADLALAKSLSLDSGAVVALPLLSDPTDAPVLYRWLRTRYRIAGLRFHLVATDATAELALKLQKSNSFEFATFARAKPGEKLALDRPKPEDPDPTALRNVLDDFHEAAAQADEDRYFGFFAPEGVFLGTDGTERWTLPEFKTWGMPYFQRESAWIFVPTRRALHVNPGGDSAWFDETIWNRTYGECRGSGALRKIEGKWKIAQYNLTFVVPNDAATATVDAIRNFQKHGKDAVLGVRTIYFVRHAEKETTPGAKDPPLTEAGRARAAELARVLAFTKLTQIHSTDFLRTQSTAAAVAESQGLKVQSYDPAKLDAFAEVLRGASARSAALVVGHSNTVPELVAKLGGPSDVVLSDSDYDQLFVLTMFPTGAAFQRLHFGVKSQ